MLTHINPFGIYSQAYFKGLKLSRIQYFDIH